MQEMRCLWLCGTIYDTSMKGTTVLDKTKKVGIMKYCYQLREGRRAPGTVTVGETTIGVLLY